MFQLANRIPRTLTITGFGVVGTPSQLLPTLPTQGSVVGCSHAARCRSLSRQGWLGLAELALVGWSANRLEPLIIKAFGDMVGKLAQEIAIE